MEFVGELPDIGREVERPREVLTMTKSETRRSKENHTVNKTRYRLPIEMKYRHPEKKRLVDIHVEIVNTVIGKLKRG